MEKVYVFGHRNPDTDSVTAAISLSNLKKEQGINAVPVILSSISRETRYALKYFKVKEPMFLNDVKLKVKDLDYSKGYMATTDISIYEAYKKMEDEGISKIPIVVNNKKILGIVSMKDIAYECLNGDYSNIETSYNNILTAIDGEKILKYDNEIFLFHHLHSYLYHAKDFQSNVNEFHPIQFSNCLVHFLDTQ